LSVQQQVECYIYFIVEANHLMTAFRSYVGLPSNYTTIITLSAMVYTTEILYLLMNIAGTSTRSHSLSICLVTSTINSYCFSFIVSRAFLLNSIPYTIFHAIKEVNCVSFGLAALSFLIFLSYLLLLFYFIILYLCNLYVLICVLEYVCRRFLLYNPVILTKLIIILVIVGKYCK